MTVSLPDLVRALPPVSEIKQLAALLLGRGGAVSDIVDHLVEVLDGLVDWSKVIKGPVGVVVEAADGALLRAFVRLIVSSVKRNAKTGTVVS